MSDAASTKLPSATDLPLILASGSPRRRTLLQEAGLTFTVETFPVDETPQPAEPADAYVQRLAREKAEAALSPLKSRYPAGFVLLAADTTVSTQGQILGKPASQQEAVSMWQQLSGQTHQVFTGVAVVAWRPDQRPMWWQHVEQTDVTFYPLSDSQMQQYWETGEPQDKAGGYAIQGEGRQFVQGIDGSLSNVIGLPVEPVLELIRAAQARTTLTADSDQHGDEHHEQPAASKVTTAANSTISLPNPMISEDILINITPMECRVALVENGIVQELFIERTARNGLVGNIYQGKVVRVLPGMQAAFVEIGLSRTGFLHVNDMVWKNQADNATPPNVLQLLHEGQTVTVQVDKDMLGSKGARLTTNLSLPSRYLVYMPFGEHIGISQRIEDDGERDRLRLLLEEIRQSMQLGGGIIVRTAAEGASREALARDLNYLQKLWEHLREKQASAPVPSLLLADLPLPQRVLRDLAGGQTSAILVDSRETFQKLAEFVSEFVPQVADRLQHYPGERPLFDLHHVEEDLQKALQKRVALKSGGYLMIDQTEAMTTIDVNTGSFVSGRSQEDTVFRTNLEATQAIARQLRLRNLGGIIILDFIDMQEESHKADVLAALQQFLARDHARIRVTGVSELGLVEMTRKRTRDSLEHILCESCPVCEGKGYLKTAETVCYDIMREIMRLARAYQAPNSYTVVASPLVIDRLLSVDAPAVADLEHFIGRTITFQVETLYSQEQYDVVLA